MTLVVVDQHRITADTYCTITDAQGNVKVEDGYSKIHPLPFRLILPSGERSFTNLAFCGDPVTFLEIYELLQVFGDADREIDYSVLLDVRFNAKGAGQLIIPFAGGVATIRYRQGRMLEVEEHHGEVFGFGNVYHNQGHDEMFTENRVWYSIFLDAIARDRLPGAAVTYRYHNDVVELDRHATATTVRAPSAKRSYRAMNRLYRVGSGK